MNYPPGQQPPPNPNKPQVLRVQQGNAVVEICSVCRNVVPDAYAYQAGNNQHFRKRACQVCGTIFWIEGPFRTPMEANPKVFK